MARPTSPYISAVFRPADPSKVDRDDLPTLPAWWPLSGAKELRLNPADEDSPTDESPENRVRVRTGRQLAEACEGPMDGQRQDLRREADGAPPRLVVLFDGSMVYLRSDAESTQHVAVYRYAPHLSPAHRKMMAAVADGFNEYGQTYAEGARHDDTSAPGYSSR